MPRGTWSLWNERCCEGEDCICGDDGEGETE